MRRRERARCTWHRFFKDRFFFALLRHGSWPPRRYQAEIALPFREFPRKWAQSRRRQRILPHNVYHTHYSDRALKNPSDKEPYVNESQSQMFEARNVPISTYVSCYEYFRAVVKKLTVSANVSQS